MLNDLDEMIRRQQERLRSRDESTLPKGIEHTHIWKPIQGQLNRAQCACGAIAQKTAIPGDPNARQIT